jgi:DNA-binding NarL/FixJ family response regulator
MKVYIVEDDEAMRILLKRQLKKNFSSITAIGESESADNALEKIPLFAPDIILVDISLPSMNGIEMIRKLKPQCQKAFIFVLTGYEVEQYQKVALEAGADGVFSKMDDRLLLTIRELLEKSGRSTI